MATKNIFDQFDAPVAPAVAAAPAPTPAAQPSKNSNVFDQFDNHPAAPSADEPQIMPQDEYLKNLHAKLQDKNESVKTIMDWSANAGHRITSPKALKVNMLDVRGGALHPDNVNVTFDQDGMAHPQGPSSSTIGSFLRGGANGATLDWGDELGENIGAAVGPVRGAVDSILGRDVLPSDDPNKSFSERRDYLRAQDQAQEEADEKQHGTAAALGYGAGIVGSSLLPIGEAADGARAIKILSGGGKVGKVVRGMAAGAGIAATDAAGQAEPGQREAAAVEAAPIGAAVGVAAPVVIGAGGRVVRAVANRTGLTDAVDNLAGKVNGWAQRLGITDPEVWKRIPADIKALAQRANVTPDQISQMREAADTFRRAGTDPRLVDVVTPTQQDAVASVIRKDQGAGRDAAYAAADQAANNLGTNIKGQFDRVTNVGSADLNDTVDRIGQRQDYRAGEVMGQLRDRPLPLDPDTVNVLNTRIGRQALNEATKAADPATRDALLKLPDLMSQLHGLGPDARNQVLQRLPNPFTVGMADRVRIALNDAAQSAYQSGKGGLAREIRGLRDTVRTAAGRSDPKYAEYLQNYGEDAKSIEARDIGAAALDRNTDEFVPKAKGLSDDPNAVLNSKDMQPSQGDYAVTRDGRNVNEYTGGHNIRVTRNMPDGRQLHFSIDAPAAGKGTTGEITVAQTDPRGRPIMFGDKEGFNTVGPAEMRDAARWFRETYGGPDGVLGHIDGLTGHRIGGAREAAQQERMRANLREQAAREQDAGVEVQHDDPTVQAAHEFANRNGYHIGATVDEFADQVDNPHHLANTQAADVQSQMLDHGHGADEPGLNEFSEHVASQLRERGQRAAAYGAGRETYEQYLADAQRIRAANPNAGMDPPLSREAFARQVQDYGPHEVPFDPNAPRDVGSPPVHSQHFVDNDGVARTSNGLSFDEMRQEYEHYRELHAEHHEVGDGPPDSMGDWVQEMFHSHEVPPQFTDKINEYDRNSTREGPGLMDDESGSKRFPGNSRQRAMDFINSRRNPPPQPDAAATGPQGSGVTTSGVDTRIRNERPSDLSASESYHAVKPREVLTDSDRQLAVGGMSRAIESKSGESIRGAYEVGRKLAYAPEQQTRNAALLGDNVAAEVQRATDAVMRQAKNTARIAPNTGSPTAIRGSDDNVSQLVNAFGHAASGNKVGLIRSIGHIFSNVGLTPAQSKNLITKVLDPAQTDTAIEQLSRYVGRDGAMEMVRHIRRLGGQAVGNQIGSQNQ